MKLLKKLKKLWRWLQGRTTKRKLKKWEEFAKLVDEMLEEPAKDAVNHALPPLPDPWFGVDSRLPRVCPLCSGPNTPSHVDDRLVACLNCKQVYMTSEAFDSPDIQRDITHARAGISCKGRNNNNDCENDEEKNNV